MTPAGTCRCGTPLPPNKAPGRPRKWCSDRCRKQTLYSGTCRDCGAPLSGSDGRGPNAPIRCPTCSNASMAAAKRAAYEQGVKRAIELRAKGATNRQIAADLDRPVTTVMQWLSHARTTGGDVPRDPYMTSRRNVPNRNVKLTDEKAAEAVRLYRSGWTAQRIADHFGVVRSTVGPRVYGTRKEAA